MNERLKELAEQAGLPYHGVDIERFAELVRADERDKCASDYLQDCCDAVEAALLEERFMEDSMRTQIGGDHYSKLAIQPMEYSLANNLNAAQHTAIKYVTRYKDKGGIEDLKKAIHTIQFLIAFEERGV